MKKYVIKDYLYINIPFDFCWFLIVAKESFKWVVFLFFHNLFCLPGGIIDEKRVGAIFKKKDKK